MQETGADIGPALTQLHQLTLLEKQTDPAQEGRPLSYSYLTPIVRELLAKAALPAITFFHAKAGTYYEYADRHINHHNLSDREEVFFHYTQIRDVDKVNALGKSLADTYYGTSLYRNALYFALEADELLKEQTHADILNRLGLILKLFGRTDLALNYYERQLPKYIEAKDRSGEGTTLNNISGIYQARGDYDTALKYLQQSLKIRQDIRDVSGMIPTLHNIAQIAWQNKDIDQFLEYETQAYQLAQKTGNATGLFRVGQSLGYLLCQMGQKERGLAMLEQSYAIGKRAGMPGVEQLRRMIEEFS
jgi:tetratricopeptide (TPR) repeat protein